MKNLIHHRRISKIVTLLTQCVYGVIFGMLFFAGGIIAISGAKLPGQIQVFVVQSGSMEPKLHVGSITAVQPLTHYGKGDIVAVRNTPNSVITHRIVSTRLTDGKTYFITQGDANKTPDQIQRMQSEIIGKEFITVPYVGYAIAFAKSKNGLLFLIIIPSIVLIMNELQSIKIEATKLIRQRKTRLTL